MHFFILLLLSILFQYSLSFYFDLHWSIFLILNMLISVIAFHRFNFTKKQILLNSFLSIFILWMFYLLYIDHFNQSILNNRIANLFNLPNKYILVIVQSLFGSLLSLMSGFVVLLFCTNQRKF
jgi:hypothetical protein